MQKFEIAAKMKESMSGSGNCNVSDFNPCLGFFHRLCLYLSNQILQFPLIFELQQRMLRQPELLRAEVVKELQSFSGKENFKILDYGCGAGTYAGLFPKENYLGIDRNPALIERARSNETNHKFIHAGDLNGIGSELDSISHVMMIGVVHHLSNEAFLSIIESLPKGKPIRILTIDTIKSFSRIGGFIQMFERGEFLRSEAEHLELLSTVADKEFYTKVAYGKWFDLAVFRGELRT